MKVTSLVMTCGHDIRLARQCVLFYSIMSCVAFFDALFISLSYFTCSAYPSERKEASSVCYDIKRSEFEEDIQWRSKLFIHLYVVTFVCLFLKKDQLQKLPISVILWYMVSTQYLCISWSSFSFIRI